MPEQRKIIDRAAAMDGLDDLSDEQIRKALTALVIAYARRAEETGEYPPPVAAEAVSATEVIVVASEMIRALDINMFDFSMWYQSCCMSKPDRCSEMQ